MYSLIVNNALLTKGNYPQVGGYFLYSGPPWNLAEGEPKKTSNVVMHQCTNLSLAAQAPVYGLQLQAC